MPLESATWIADLDPTNPASTDKKKEGDDHLRMIKSVLKNNFPNANRPLAFPSTESKTSNFTITVADLGKLFVVSTNVEATLPVLTASDANWECSFVKMVDDAVAFFIKAGSGTLASGEVFGLSRTRRCIPGHLTRALWTGSGWAVSRVPRDPVGTIIDFAGANLPKGYEWANGQNLVATNYPDLVAVMGSSTVPDMRGRIGAGKDNMGGVAANRITSGISGINGSSLLSGGGAEGHTLTTSQMPEHAHGLNGSTGDDTPDHSHPTQIFNPLLSGGSFASAAPFIGKVDPAQPNTGGASTRHTHPLSGNTSEVGGDAVHNNVQPTLILNKIVVVE